MRRAADDRFGVWNCRACGKEERATVHQLRKTYCSKSCEATDYAKRMAGENNPNYKAIPAKFCANCGAGFHSYDKSRVYCGRACSAATQTKLKEKACAHCGAAFKPNTEARKFCSVRCSRAAKPLVSGYVPRPRQKHVTDCACCGTPFVSSPSSGRKFCSYGCFILSGGAKRAGEASTMAKLKYGAKKDANHNEVFEAIKKITAAYDLSAVGFGVPDGIAWVNNGWHLFDIKNAKTGYGRRGLNPIQKKWADDWRGGPVFLVYNVDDAIALATGKFDRLKKFPEDNSRLTVLELRGEIS